MPIRATVYHMERMDKMGYFPLFIEMEGRKALVVGAGRIASRRIRVLVEFGAAVTVAAREVSPEVEELAESGKILLFRGDYRVCRGQIEKEGPFFLVLAATGEEEADRLAEEDGRAGGSFVNVAGDRSRSDFYFPGIARARNVTAGVTAEGTDHRLAKEITAKIRECLREELMGKEEDNE